MLWSFFSFILINSSFKFASEVKLNQTVGHVIDFSLLSKSILNFYFKFVPNFFSAQLIAEPFHVSTSTSTDAEIQISR